MEKRRWIRIFTLISIAVIFYILGYFRNEVFLYLNAQSAAAWYHNPPVEPLTGFSFTAKMDYNGLQHLKWLFTFGFYGLFFLLSFGAIYLLFRKRIYLRLCILFYLALLAVALLFSLSGRVILSFSEHAYNISRSLIHIGQSPFIPLLIFMIIYFHQRNYSSGNQQPG